MVSNGIEGTIKAQLGIIVFTVVSFCYFNNTMKMIGHYDKFVQANLWKMVGNF